MRHVFCLLLLWVFFAPPVQAAWTQGKDEIFTSNSLLFYETRHFIDDDGNTHRQPPFRKYEWNLYAEYGLREGTTLGFNSFLHRLDSKSTNDSRRNYGLADTEFFLRHRIWEGRGAVFSIQPLLKLPSLYAHDRQPLSGTDAVDMELRLLSGYGFRAFDRHHYARLDIAYRHRTGLWRDQLKADATLGLQIKPGWTLMPQLFLTRRVEGTARNTGTAAAVNDYDLLKGQISVLYDLNRQTSLQLGAFSHLHARNTGGGEGVILGIWHRF